MKEILRVECILKKSEVGKEVIVMGDINSK